MQRLVFRITLPIFFLLSAGTLYAQNTIKGVVDRDVTLYRASSPYQLIDDLVVMNGSKLTIEPGVSILVDGDYTIYIRGEIEIIGAPEDTVTIKMNGSDTSRAQWKGLVFEAGHDSDIVLEYLKIENAREAIDIDQDGGSLTMNHCYFDRNYSAVYCDNAPDDFPVYITNSRFRNHNAALYNTNNLDVRKTRFEGWGYAIYGGIDGPGVYINECVFSNLSRKPILQIGGTMENSLIESCTAGMWLRPSLIIRSCEYWNNTVAIEIVSYDYPENTLHNTLFCNNDIDIKNNSNQDISLPGNCWCIDDNEPDSGIFDVYDDVSLGRIEYIPLGDNCGVGSTLGSKGVTTRDQATLVFPNPASDRLYFSVSEVVKATTSDISGRPLDSRLENGAIDISSLPPGVYLTKIEQNDGSIQRVKWVKE